MGVDRRNYVMSVEVAMAREMAYRDKLQCETSISCSTKDPLHSQAPTQNSHMSPFPQPHTSQSQIWSPTIVAGQSSMSTTVWRPVNLPDQKRKAPVNNDKTVQLGTFYCLVCQIDCTTSHNLMMHYQGQRHMAKLLGQPSFKGKKVAGGSGLSTTKDRLFCKLCGIWCKDEYTFRYHLQCKSHIVILHEHEKKMKKPM